MFVKSGNPIDQTKSFNYSSFNEGNDVVCAGRCVFSARGVLLYIDNGSASAENSGRADVGPGSGCAHEKLVAFSCKRRGVCPSCGGMIWLPFDGTLRRDLVAYFATVSGLSVGALSPVRRT